MYQSPVAQGRKPPRTRQARDGRSWSGWILSLIAGTVLIDAFGIALAVAHKHFAVS